MPSETLQAHFPPLASVTPYLRLAVRLGARQWQDGEAVLLEGGLLWGPALLVGCAQGAGDLLIVLGDGPPGAG